MKKSFLSVLFILSLCSFSFAQESPTKPPTDKGIGNGIGSGSGKVEENKVAKSVVPNADKVISLRILSKMPASYTDAARENGVEGSVRLRVTFSASGKIGSVAPVSALPYGLTEQAIMAARNIKFEPASRNGIPISVAKLVEYNFYISYKENDKALAQNAEILEMPQAEHPQESNLQNLSGVVKVTVVFNSNGTARVTETKTDLPKEFVQKATEAVGKVKFNPAIHKNGNAVTQTKEIEYEFSRQQN